MNKALILQLFRFGLVGAFCFLIDYGLLLLLTEGFHLHYLLSGGISFSVSVVVNYLLSMHCVFKRKENSRRFAEFLLFLLFSIGGLLLTELLLWFFVETVSLHYTFSKIVVTVLVMAYNFITRKLFLEERNEKSPS